MEVLEPLWTTMTVVHDLVKAHNDLGGELAQLGETVKLISLAVKPLLGNLIKERETQEDSDAQNKDLFEVFTALRQVLEEAEKSLKQLDEEKKSRFYFLLHPFRPQSHIEEIKCHLEKLKTLTPILTLAINSQQHHSKSHHENPNVNNSFSASKMLKNDSSKDFWVRHFGDKEYAVSWSRFIAALSHEFSDKFLKEGISLHFHVRSLKGLLDKNGDDEIDIYEYDNFTSTKGLYQACFDLFQSNNNKTTSTDRKRKSDDKEETTKTKVLKTEETTVMGPPTSPAKKSSKENDNNKEDNNNTKEDDYAYQLVLIGKQSIISQQCFKDYQVFRKPWSESPFTIGRADFAQLPAELLVRISRMHFEVQCKEDSTTSKREFWLKDMSGNGTYVNGKHVGHSKQVKLEDGDRIGILMAKPQLIEVEFGYLFKIKPAG